MAILRANPAAAGSDADKFLYTDNSDNPNTSKESYTPSLRLLQPKY
jgi:hypothetical protein